jgi:hypothetical protein
VGVNEGMWWNVTDLKGVPNSQNIGTLLGIAKDALGQLGYGAIQIDQQGYACGNKNGVILMVLYTGVSSIFQTVVVGAGGYGGEEAIAKQDGKAFIKLASEIHPY